MGAIEGALAELICPRCGAILAAAEGIGPCRACVTERSAEGVPRRRPAFLRVLISMAHAYRAWSLGIFSLAVIELLRLADARAFWLGSLILFPFGAALAIAYRRGTASSRWLVAFLLLVDFGVIIAPAHRFLPGLHLFPELRPTQSRILAWYFLVYFTLQFVVAPPIAFGRSLHTAWRGDRPVLAPWICVFGLLVWGLVMVLVILLLKSWLMG
jgi:hypothetical protein